LTGIIDESSIIDVPVCEICHASLPKGRGKYCSDKCRAEGKRQIEAERYQRKKEQGESASSLSAEKSGMITMSVEQYTDILRRVIRQERQETEEEIYTKTIQVIDSRFNSFKSDISKQLEQIQHPPASETLPTEVPVPPIEEHLLQDTNSPLSKHIDKILGDMKTITGKSSYAPFNRHFKIGRHTQLKEKDGNRAVEWVNKQIRLAKQKQNHLMDEWTPASHERREDA